MEPASKNDEQIKFQAFQLTSKKDLTVVPHGIPVEMKEKQIKDDLNQLGYITVKIFITNGKFGPAPPVLVVLSRNYNN